MLERLSEAITDAGIPLERIDGAVGAPVLVFQPSATDPQKAQAQAIADAFDWSQSAHEAWFYGKLKTAYAPQALELKDQLGLLLRAEAAVIIDEVNALRQQIVGVSTFLWDPPNIANGSGATSPNVTVSGAVFGDVVDVANPYTLSGLTATAYVSAANTVNVRLHNGTGAAVNLASSAAWKVVVRRHTVLPDRTLAQAKSAIKNKITSGAVD